MAWKSRKDKLDTIFYSKEYEKNCQTRIIAGFEFLSLKVVFPKVYWRFLNFHSESLESCSLVQEGKSSALIGSKKKPILEKNPFYGDIFLKNYSHLSQCMTEWMSPWKCCSNRGDPCIIWSRRPSTTWPLSSLWFPSVMGTSLEREPSIFILVPGPSENPFTKGTIWAIFIPKFSRSTVIRFINTVYFVINNLVSEIWPK